MSYPHFTASYILVVDVRALAQLDNVMGKTVIDTALGELYQRLSEIFRKVLARAHAFKPLTSNRRGRWSAYFIWSDNPLAEDRAEALEVIETAAQRLVSQLALEVFGGSTSQWTAIVAKVLSLPAAPGVADLDAWMEPQMQAAKIKTSNLDHLRETIESIIENDSIRLMLQPIVSFADRKIVGFEALSRGPLASELEQADKLFSAAARTGLSLELEKACALKALSWANRLSSDRFLAINLSMPLLMDTEIRSQLSRPGIIVEITEHLPIDRAVDLVSALQELRNHGARIALDDTGCGFADAAAVEILRPDIVKLCITVIRSARRNPQVISQLQQIIRNFRALEATILAEGVETEEEWRILSPLEPDLAQGWLFGKAFPAEKLS